MAKTEILKCSSSHPEPAILEKAAEALKEGKLVAFPTDTVYGLGVNLSNKSAVERLYKIKSRPASKPLVMQVSSRESLEGLAADMTKEARSAIERFWPGPLTIILKDKFGSKTAFRMPDNKIALGILDRCGFPLGVPSANISGDPAPGDSAGVMRGLDGLIDMIIDGGRVKLGTESTIVDFTASPPKILREGAVSREDLQKYG